MYNIDNLKPQIIVFALWNRRQGQETAHTLRGKKNELEHEFPLAKQVGGKLQTIASVGRLTY
jgi:hypothetical protein